MTSILTRSPLEHMPMNRASSSSSSHAAAAAAGSTAARRRTTRRFDEIEEEGDAPKKKTTMTTTSRGAGGEAEKESGASVGARRANKSYDESIGGFAFTRTTKSKRRRLDAGGAPGSDVAAPAPAPSSQAAVAAAAGSPAPDAAPQPKKRSQRKTVLFTPEGEPVRTVRRSKRLSGDGDEARRQDWPGDDDDGDNDPFVDKPARVDGRARGVATAEATTTRTEAAARQEARDGSPRPARSNGVAAAAAAADVVVAKKHRGAIVLVSNDETPVHHRNKALRRSMAGGGSGSSSRRSSSDMRGKRISGLMEGGGTDAMPHGEVDTADFYKHIEQSGLNEQNRMRVCMVWCAKRALEDRVAGAGTGMADGQGNTERRARDIARRVQHDLLEAYKTRTELSSWFDRPDAATSASQVKRANPRNVQNVAKLAELEAETERLQAEKASWESLRSSIPRPSRPSTTAEDGASLLDPTRIDQNLLAPSQAQILETLLQPLTGPPPGTGAARTTTTTTHEQVQDRLSAAASDLQFKIDTYHDSLHRITQFVDTAARAADRVLANAAARLEERERERREKGEREHGGGAGARVGERDLLRGLGRVLNGNGGRGGSS